MMTAPTAGETITGRPFPHFPTLSAMTRGLHGVFIIAGVTGIGKSTLAAHLAGDLVCDNYPCIYYESENRLRDANGEVRSLAIEKIKRAYGAEARFKGNLGYYDNYAEARETALAQRRGFMVIDTIQGSLGRDDYSRDAGAHDAMNQRAVDIIELVDAGLAVLVVSHVNVRNLQGAPDLHHLKLSGALEQAAWIVGGYYRLDDAGAFRVRKWRIEAPAGYVKTSVLRLALDESQRLHEVGLVTVGATKAPRQAKKETPAERVARARSEHPAASKREVARLAGVPWPTARRMLSGGSPSGSLNQG